MKKNESIEIKRVLDILVSKKVIVLCILIVFMVFGYIYTYHFVVPKYQATSTLLLIPNDTYESRELTNIELLINSELITTYSSIAQNSKILKQTIRNLGLDMTEKQLLSQMKVRIVDESYIIEISISNTNPKTAMEINNELSSFFLK